MSGRRRLEERSGDSGPVDNSGPVDLAKQLGAGWGELLEDGELKEKGI